MIPYSKQHSKVSLSHDIPPHFSSLEIRGSRQLYGQTEHAQALLQSMTTPEYAMYFVRLTAAKQENILLARGQPSYFLVVQLKNTLDFSLPGLSGLRLLEWSFNFLYTPRFELEAKMKKQSDYETFFLIVPEAFMHYFSKQYDTLRNFHTRTKDKTSQTLFPFPKTCPLNIIQSILAVKQTGMTDLNLHFAEDLLTSVFQTADSVPYRKINYADEVIERLYAMKAFMQDHLESDITKNELMQRFHLNAEQFSKGFAAIYNLTPFSLMKFLKRQGPE